MKKLLTIGTSLALLALLVSPTLALEEVNGNDWNGGWNHKGGITVMNTKMAEVQNQVMVVANTGGNTANGGDAGAAGNGGSVSCSEDDNIGGAGGAGGNGGEGGVVVSGAATILVELGNDINYDETWVEPACTDCLAGDDVDESDIEKVMVVNFDSAALMNGVMPFADTGHNTANGGKAKDAGSGGSIDHSEDGNLGGAGGVGGAGGLGGGIQTADSTVGVSIVNRLNTIINKIKF